MKYVKRRNVLEIPLYDQEFSQFVDDFILNEKTNTLEKSPTPKDTQAYIQSFEKCALESILESFGAQPDVVDDRGVRDFTAVKQDLAAVGEAYEIAENYRERLQLGDDMSVAEVYQRMSKYADDLEQQLKIKEVKENAEKKEDVPQGE